jgi:hypothetical protein
VSMPLSGGPGAAQAKAIASTGTSALEGP